MPGLRAMRSARARARPGRGAAACVPGSPAPRSLRRGRRQRRARRRLRPPLPLRPPPPLRSCRLPRSSRLFSPSWGGGVASRAEPSRGRGGAGRRRRRPRTRRRRRREASCFPPPGCRRSPISPSLKLDPESGARDCITDYIRLYRASRSHIRGERERGAGCGGGERDNGVGGTGKTHTSAHTEESPAPAPCSRKTKSWVSALCLFQEPRSGCRWPAG